MHIFSYSELSNKVKGYLNVLGCFLLMMTGGSLYTYGNMASYLVSYLHYHQDWVSYTYASYIFSIAMSCGVSALMIDYLEKKLKIKITLLISIIIFIIGVFITAFTCTNYWLTLLSYGLIYGIGVGMKYQLSLTIAMRWFPKNKGFISGIVLFGYGISPLAINQLITYIINPDHKQLPEGEEYFKLEDVLNVPKCFVILGGIYITLDLLALLLIHNPPNNLIQIEVNSSNTSINTELFSSDINCNNNIIIQSDNDVNNDDHIFTESNQGIPLKQVLKLYIFYFIYIICGSTTIGVTVHTTFWKEYGERYVTNDDYFLSIVGSCSAIFNALGRLFWGSFYDKFKFRISMITMHILLFIFFLTLPNITNNILYFIYICILSFCVTGGYAQFPSETSNSFGHKYFSSIYSVVFTSLILGSLLTSTLAIFIVDNINLSGLYYCTAAVYFLNIFIIIFGYKPYRWGFNHVPSRDSIKLSLLNNESTPNNITIDQ